MDVAFTADDYETAISRGCDYCRFMIDNAPATCRLDGRLRFIPYSPHDGHVRPKWCPVVEDMTKDGYVPLSAAIKPTYHTTCSVDEAIAVVMRARINELEDENAKMREMIWDAWFYSYCGYIDQMSQEEQMEHIDGFLQDMKKLGIGDKDDE